MNWNTNPEIFTIGMFHIHWYGLFFASAFVLGYGLIQKMFAAEKTPPELVDTLLWHVMAGTFIGARLGHCLFYEPQTYLADPIRIFKIWEGGLASHGAAIGIIVSLSLYVRRHKEYSFLQIFDRLCPSILLSCFMIRMGNFFNSEIIGRPSTLPWAITFQRVDSIPRHPAMLYEATVYITLFFVVYRMFWKTQAKKKVGFLFGFTLIGIFLARFILEFVKENQVQFESTMPLNMGQLLSIPLVILGVVLMIRAKSPAFSAKIPAKRKAK